MVGFEIALHTIDPAISVTLVLLEGHPDAFGVQIQLAADIFESSTFASLISFFPQIVDFSQVLLGEQSPESLLGRQRTQYFLDACWLGYACKHRQQSSGLIDIIKGVQTPYGLH